MTNTESAVWDFVEKHFDQSDIRYRNGQILIRECPFCKGGASHDEFTFAIGTFNGAYNCMRARECNVKGSFNDLLAKFGERPHETDMAQSIRYNATKKKSFEKPNEEDYKDLTDEIINYFAGRRISEKTLRDWKIRSDKDGNIVFPFYRDNVLVYVKFRKPKKYEKGQGSKEWQLKNTEAILFGMDNVSFNKPLVICEGEIDALSLYEAGITNVVSVPLGANNLEWINTCWEWLESFNQIILFGDSDEPGRTMVYAVMKRLGEDRCLIAKEYPQLVYKGKDYGKICKDANDILICYGAEGLKEAVKNCEPAPIKGILNLASVPFVDASTRPKILTKIPALDFAIGGLMEGGVTIFSGKRGEGKSTISGQLALNAIQEGHSVCSYSGELPAEVYLEWIMLQATEKGYVDYKRDERTGQNLPCVPATVQQRIREWLDGKFFLYDNSCIMEEKQEDSILKVFEACARRYGCKLFILDNLMSALTSADEENKAQAKFTARLKAFASKYKVHVIMVAHPRKTKADATFTNDDIAGSSVISNLADNVINVERPNLRVTKNRYFGRQDYIVCNYNPANRRIYQQNTGDTTVYGWDHTGLTPLENPANNLPEFAIQQGTGRPY